MPSYETEGPITATIHVEVGVARISATDRTDTVVEIHPRTAGNKDDIRAAEETYVEFDDGTLTIRTPRARGLFSARGAVTVEVALPQGSRLQGTLELGDISCKGTLGQCEVRTSAGHIRLDQAGPVRLKTQHGDVQVDTAAGDVDITTGSGEVRVRTVDGKADIKNSNGNTWLDDVAGDLRLKVANGNITVGRAQGSVSSKSSNGNVRIEDVARGTVELQTKAGDIEVGIRQGTAAWLDINSQAGTVHSTLGSAEGPAAGAETVKVHARTSLGDITIQRAHGA
ncbi:DUF4097 family beta strand repeat-containing protein [Streptomyces virginiae]|uniref:DUF4097 family beta strand repeat-containing protein n=1 Tax=Streptomyces virginiae TaxID=1961 RepID=UPI0022557B21|nr:DUF4097 family beta strand repeat-containing protein [Streptomyces virginiae]MCX4957478.1 DUF4097 family beta strand repeat-containing protein [Streptomyces virginiae]